MMERPPFFPMMIDMKNKRVLIAGGGNVASRRAETLLRCGAEIIAVSPEFAPKFPEGTQRITRKFSPGDITEGLSLIIAATNDRFVNHTIHLTARKASIPVNVADCQEECDFFFPSLINSGYVAVAVSSAGKSSSLTRRLSDRLRNVWSAWVAEVSELPTL